MEFRGGFLTRIKSVAGCLHLNFGFTRARKRLCFINLYKDLPMSNQAKQIKQNLTGETVVELRYPVRLATGQTLEKVAVRRPRVGDLRAVMHITGEAEQGLMLVSRVTGLVPEDLDMLDLKDLEAIQATFRSGDEADGGEPTGV